VAYAADGGYHIKLLGRARPVAGGRISAVVGPMLVPQENLLANVNDVYNAIMIHGDAVGDVVFYGRGAGKFPTASAVVADIIDCAKHTERRRFFDWDANDPDFVAPAEEEVTKLYVRALGAGAHERNAHETWALVTASMPGAKRLCRDGAPLEEFAFITPAVQEGEAKAALAAIAGMEIKAVMRVY